MQVRGSHKRFLPVRCYWLRLRWCCTRCSNRRLDTRDTAGSPTGTGIRTGSPSAVSSWSLQWKEFLKGSGFLIHNPITNQCVYADQRAKSYFLHVRKHKTVLSDSIRSASCRCIWWICRSWEDKGKDKRFKPGEDDTVSRCRSRKVSPPGETAARCASDNTGSCLRCHTWTVRPTRRRVSHSDKVSTCSHDCNGANERSPTFSTAALNLTCT